MHACLKRVQVLLFKTLHFTSPLIINFRDNATYSYAFQHGSGPIHICNVQCNGTETDLTECWQYYDEYYSGYCFHYKDIYIKCDSGKATNLIFIRVISFNISNKICLCLHNYISVN